MQIYKYAEKHSLETKELLTRLKDAGFKVTPLNKMTDEMLKVLGGSDGIRPSVVEVSSSGDMSFKHDVAEPKTNPDANSMKFYQAKSERLCFGGYKPEERGLGFLKADESIQFENHVYITDDPKKQAFIESTDRFKFKDVIVIDAEKYNQLMEELASKRIRIMEESANTAGRVG